MILNWFYNIYTELHSVSELQNVTVPFSIDIFRMRIALYKMMTLFLETDKESECTQCILLWIQSNVKLISIKNPGKYLWIDAINPNILK